MKSVTLMVDAFVEEFFDGTIITLPHMRMKGIADKEFGYDKPEHLVKELTRLVGDLIPKYVRTDEANKSALALEIFDIVVVLRSLGILSSNPKSVKELNFHRTRIAKLEEEKGQLEKQVVALANMVKDLKVGSGAIR